MITCKLCSTELAKKDLRHDGSMICPVCGQVYWQTAIDKAILEQSDTMNPNKNTKKEQ